MPSVARAFEKHLERLRNTTAVTREIMGKVAPGLDPASASLATVWDMVFSFLVENEDEALDVGELNTLAGLIQKLWSCQNQLTSLEIKIREDSRKDEEFALKIQQLRKLVAESVGGPDSGKGISPATLERIERELKLL
jgi:hypothetical protein